MQGLNSDQNAEGWCVLTRIYVFTEFNAEPVLGNLIILNPVCCAWPTGMAAYAHTCTQSSPY